MSFKPDLATVDLKFNLRGSATAAHVGSARVLMHCNQGAANLGAADTSAAMRGTKQGPPGHAITLTGSVFLESSSPTFVDRDDWEFGMVQVSTLLSYENVYAGKTRAQGSTKIDLAAGFSSRLTLDVDPDEGETIDQHIFSNGNLVATKVLTPRPGFKITVVGGDHPNHTVKFSFENRVARAQNLLASARRDEGFITYFVAREDANKPLICLARVGWHAVWDVAFKWRSGVERPTPQMRASAFHTGVVIKGQPVDGDPEWTVARNRTLPSTNAQDQAAQDRIESRSRPVVAQIQDWPPDLPADFFR